MVKTSLPIVAAFLLTSTLASSAQAGPVNETRRDAVAGKQHDYWLSDGLNRLAFWQTTPTHRIDTRRR